MGPRVIQAILRLGRLADAGGNTRAADRHYRDVLREYEVRGYEPSSDAAWAAAEARFLLIEREFEVYADIRLTGSNRRMRADMARKREMLEELTEDYNAVLEFRALDWTIAAAYRLGDIYREFAQTLYQAPIPPGMSMEEEDIFLNEIENLGLQFENQAIMAFEQAVLQSRRLKVTNEWAFKALQAINRYKPQDYPLYKETKQLPTFLPVYRVDPGVEVPR